MNSYFAVLVVLFLSFPLVDSTLTCNNGGYKVNTPDGEKCFCVYKWKGLECTSGQGGPSLTSAAYPCDPDADDSSPDSCTNWLSRVNVFTSDPLQHRVSFSDYDMREFDRLTEATGTDQMMSRRGAVAIDERSIWYGVVPSDSTVKTKIVSYDLFTKEEVIILESDEVIMEIVRSRHSEEVLLMTKDKIIKYDTSGNEVNFKWTLSVYLTPPTGKEFLSINQIPLAQGAKQQSIIALLNDRSIYRLCDRSFQAAEGEDPCEEEVVATISQYNGLEESYHFYDYHSSQVPYISDPGGMAVLPDLTGAYEFTVVTTHFTGYALWVSSTGEELSSCAGRDGLEQYYPSYYDACSGLMGFMEKIYGKSLEGMPPAIHTSEIYYDEGRDIVIFGEYSFGAPKVFTSRGAYIGELGPRTGFHSSSTGIVVRPGPLARLSTFKTPTSAIAGEPVDVIVYAKDYLNQPWTKNSPDNFKMEAHGFARSGAALIYIKPVVSTNVTTGMYTATIAFEEMGTYNILVTEGPGNQKLVHPDTLSDSLQSITIQPAATAAKYTELIVSSECDVLRAGGECDLEVHPKDIFGNDRSTVLPSDVFVMKVKNPFGEIVYNTTSFGDESAPITFNINSTKLEKGLAAKYIVEVTFKGSFISGSPYQLAVTPADYHVGMITVATAEIYDPTIEEQTFEVSLHDAFGNFIVAEQEHIDDLKVEFYRPRAGFEFENDKVDISSSHNSTVTPSGTIQISLKDDKRQSSDLRFTLSFTPNGGKAQYVMNPETGTEYFDINYKRSLLSKLMTPEVIAGIAGSAVLIIALASYLIYKEKLKTNKLKAAIKNQKFTVEEMRMLDDIMANSNFGDELKDSTYVSKDVEVKKRLGMGAFGEVFLASRGGDTVAIKTLKQISESNVKRFRGEMVLIKALNHPAIVQYMGCVWDREMIGLMLEFVDGGALSDLLQDTQVKLDWEEPKLMQATDIANAMVYLHSTRYWEDEKQEWMNCVIHRDLKPDNMLVVKETLNIKLTDFGEARARKPDKTMTQVGTPIFIAPEVMKGDKYDERCDVFSYAICLLDMMQISDNIVELFAEAYIDFKHTDAGLSLVAITHSVVTEGLRPDIPDYVPRSLKALVEECWDANPEARPYFPEIFDRLGYEVKAEVFGHKLDVQEQEKRQKERLQRLSQATLETNREKVLEAGVEPAAMVKNMFENSGDSAQSTARIDNLVKEKEELETEVKTLRAKNQELNGLLSGGYVPGAGAIEDEGGSEELRESEGYQNEQRSLYSSLRGDDDELVSDKSENFHQVQ